MANTNIKLFDENKTNMMSDADYGSDTQRTGGVQTGVASSQLQNKFQYQMSLVAYAIAQLMLANGKDALDSSAVSTFVSNLSNSVVQKVLDKATAAEVTAGTNDTHWVTPKDIKTITDAVRNEKQDKITASGPLVGNGNGGVSTGAWPCNPNMLDNWYWANPVNQRQQTVYTGGSNMSIDRWRIQSPGSTSSVTVNDGYVTVVSEAGTYIDLVHYFEKPLARGTRVTLTALLSDGSIITRTGGIGNMAAIVNQWRSATPTHVALRFGDTPYNIVAVKMELGDKQTLCRLGSDGKYILNDVPNYQQQLAQCQRFCAVIKTQTYKRADLGSLSQFWFYVPTPTTLRGPLRIESGSAPVIHSFDTDTGVAQSGFTFEYDPSGFGDASIRIRATKKNHGLSDATIYFGDVVFTAEDGIIKN